MRIWAVIWTIPGSWLCDAVRGIGFTVIIQTNVTYSDTFSNLLKGRCRLGLRMVSADARNAVDQLRNRCVLTRVSH